MGATVTIDEYLALGGRQFQSGQLAEAEKTFREIVAAHPDHAASLHILGVIAARTGRPELAADWIDKAIAANGAIAEFHNSKGNVLFALGRLDDAVAAYRQATSLKPNYVEAYFNWGVVLQSQKRLEEAAAQYRRVLEMKPNEIRAEMNLGSVHAMQRDFSAAIAHFQRVLDLAPRSLEARNNLGHALSELGRPGEAAVQFRRVLEFDPNEIEAQMNLGTVLAMQGEFAEAARFFQRVTGLAPQSAEARNNLGNALSELGRLDEAVVQFRQAIALKPDYAQAECALGNTLQQQGKVEEAIQHFRWALAIAPDYVKARIDLGSALAEQGRLSDAQSEAEIAARCADQPNFPHYLLGVLFARCGLVEQARAEFVRSLEDDPEDKQGARVCLAALGFGPMPERASGSQLDQFYNLRAAWWDREDMHTRPYRAATSLAETVRKLVPRFENLDALDAGCGAGLIWLLIGHKVRRLVGVDRAAGMLVRARQKNIYTELHEDDLVQFMASRPQQFDVVTSGAVLLHFGDLKPVFDAAATALRDKGLFLFTLFHNSADESGVAIGSFEGGQVQTASFVHGRDYIVRAAQSAGFGVEMMEREVFDKFEGRPRMGLVVVLRRHARGAA